MSDFTRVTVIGTQRRAELVIPDDEAISTLLPRLMDLLDEPAGPVARPLALVRVSGEQVEAALTAAEQQLVDGERLRLVRAAEAPPPPEVADVTDVVGDSFAERRDRWSETARYAAAAVGVGSLAAVGGLVGNLPAGPGTLVVVLLVVAAITVGRTGGTTDRRWPVVVCTAAAAGLCLPLAQALLRSPAIGAPLLGSGTAPLTGWVGLTVALGWTVLGVGIGLGLRSRPAGPGAVVGLALTALPLVLTGAGLAAERTATLTALAAVIVLGLLPWYALSSSGLTGLDDQVLAGTPSRRSAATRTVDEAYRALSWTATAVAVPLGASAAVLVGSPDRWEVVLGLVVITITALRTRAFPLIVQQIPLVLAALAGSVAAVLTHQPSLTPARQAGLLVAGAVVVAVAAGVQPAAHHRARLRRFGNLLEALAVIALLPLILGVFGVYGQLVGTFR